MLSICIPIYNHDVTELIKQLHDQAEGLNIDFEIICIDDCSEKFYKDKNSEICRKFSNYIELDSNIGRSKIRNLFLKYAKYDYLLFMDCDLCVISHSYLRYYVDRIKTENSLVICGGHVYTSVKPARNKRLKWKYGVYRESRPLESRLKNPAKSFMTGQFIIKKEILDKIRFDERLTKYGHEDTLFGYQLKKNGIKVDHINNPLLISEIDNNEVFLNKTEQSLKNLIRIIETNHDNFELLNDISIISFYRRIKKMKLLWMINLISAPLLPLVKYILSAGISSLVLFDFYKLMYLVKELRKSINLHNDHECCEEGQ